MQHLQGDFAESSQRPEESRVLQKTYNIRDIPGVSASMIRMFMWPLKCLDGSSSELTLAGSNLGQNRCEETSLGTLANSLQSNQNQ